ELQPSKDTIVVGTQNNHLAKHIPLSPRARGALDRLVPGMDVSPVGIQLFAARQREPLAWVHRARALLNREHELRFAGMALRDPKSGGPVVYSENEFVKFRDGLSRRDCE